MDKEECKYACDTLDMLMGTLKEKKVCYLAKNGKCRQDGRYKIGESTKISPICKKDGNFSLLYPSSYCWYFGQIIKVIISRHNLFLGN